MSVAFIDQHRETYGVEPICRVLPIAPSTYFRHKRLEREPTRRSARAQKDEELRAIIRRIWNEHHQVYGPRKVWKQMGRENLRVARCRVRRLMRDMGLVGATRGRAWTTTDAGGAHARPAWRSGRSALHGDAPESAVGRGFYVWTKPLARRTLRISLARSTG
jgi:putative transposase